MMVGADTTVRSRGARWLVALMLLALALLPMTGAQFPTVENDVIDSKGVIEWHPACAFLERPRLGSIGA